MSNIAIIKNGRVEYLESVNTGDYVVDPNVNKNNVIAKDGVVINPDLSTLANVDQKYWKIENGEVKEMIKAEKDIVDLAEANKQKELKDNFSSIDIPSLVKALIKKGVLSKEDLDG